MDNWITLWNMYFGTLDKHVAAEWLKELSYRKADADPDELSHVVRAMEKDKNCPRRPTLRDLKAAIWRHRDEQKQWAREHESPADGPVDCRLCGGSGLLCFTCEMSPAGGVRLGTIRLGDAGAPGLVSCPCECDRGRRMYQCDSRITDAVVALHRRGVRVPDPKRREAERADLW